MDNASYLGILNTQTIAYAGFALLGLFLLIIIIYALINANAGTLLTVATTVVSGALLIILAYFIIYSMSATIIGVDNPTIDVEAPLSMPLEQTIPEQTILPQSINGLVIDVLPNTSTVRIYWEVINGVGCCDALGCVYEEFETQCLIPFKLYNIYLDGVALPLPDALDPLDYEYYWQDCEHLSPWNEYPINTSTGIHELRIEQKDCEVIVDTKTTFFELAEVDGTYYVVME